MIFSTQFRIAAFAAAHLALFALLGAPPQASAQRVASAPATPPNASQTNQVAIRISGLESLTPAEVLDTLGERLIYVRRPPASEATASDAAFLIRHLLREQGFPWAQVTATPSQDGTTIHVSVEEGDRRKITEVEFSGHSVVEEARLRRLLNAGLLPGTRRARAIPFVERRVDDALENIERYYHGLGHWHARATAKPEFHDEVKLFVDIREGPPLPMGPIRFASTSPELQAALEPVAARHLGQTASTAHIEALRSELVSTAAAAGFKRSRVRLAREIDTDGVEIIISATSPPPVNVGEIAITGLERTRIERVESRFAPLQGTTYDPREFHEQIGFLLETGAFSGIQLTEVFDTEDDVIHLLVETEEEPPIRIGAYGGVGSFEGWIGGLLYENFNAGGHLHQLTSRVEMSGVGPLGTAEYTIPRILQTNWDAGLNASLLYRDFDGYAPLTASLSVPLSRTWDNGHQLRLEAGASLTSISRLRIPRNLAGPTDYQTLHATISHTINRTDSRLAPTSGWRIRHQHSVVWSPESEIPMFTRHRIGLATYIPFGDRHNLALGLSATGILTSEPERIPINERVFAGGANSHRAFRSREFGPNTPDLRYNIGGLAEHLAQAEWSTRIVGPLALAVFADAGDVFERSSDWDPGSWRFGYGAGLRLNLPTGPIRLDYGHNPSREPGERSGALHFSLGITF